MSSSSVTNKQLHTYAYYSLVHMHIYNSCCKFRQTEAKREGYKQNYHFHLPVGVLLLMKPILRDLAEPELLKKCLPRRSQNQNEFPNAVIWAEHLEVFCS